MQGEQYLVTDGEHTLLCSHLQVAELVCDLFNADTDLQDVLTIPNTPEEAREWLAANRRVGERYFS